MTDDTSRVLKEWIVLERKTLNGYILPLLTVEFCGSQPPSTRAIKLNEITMCMTDTEKNYF